MAALNKKSLGKLYHLKSWFEVTEAARYLSLVFDEPVLPIDVLRLAMERHLVLSVDFALATAAHPGRAVPFTVDHVRVVPNLDGEGEIQLVDGTVIGGGSEVIVYGPDITSIHGVWDLPMIGGECSDVGQCYQQAVGVPVEDFYNLEGTFVTDGQGTYCKLVERFDQAEFPGLKFHPRYSDPSNFYPAARLPPNSRLVVRRAAIEEFLARLSALEALPETETEERPVGQRERNTLLVIISALARMAKLDITKPSSAAAAIESETTLMGARIAARTIEDHLNRVSNAVDSRKS